MRPVNFEGSNHVFHKPKDLTDEQCESLYTRLEQTELGPQVTSYWKPTPEELEILNSGGCIRMSTLGVVVSPVYLTSEKVKLNPMTFIPVEYGGFIIAALENEYQNLLKDCTLAARQILFNLGFEALNFQSGGPPIEQGISYSEAEERQRVVEYLANLSYEPTKHPTADYEFVVIAKFVKKYPHEFTIIAGARSKTEANEDKL